MLRAEVQVRRKKKACPHTSALPKNPKQAKMKLFFYTETITWTATPLKMNNKEK